MICPRCQRDDLPRGAQSCDCGWKARKAASAPEMADRYSPVKCAVEPCYLDAMPGHRLCPHHYLQPFQNAAIDKCEALGLNTVPEMRAWLKKATGKTFKRFGAEES